MLGAMRISARYSNAVRCMELMAVTDEDDFLRECNRVSRAFKSGDDIEDDYDAMMRYKSKIISVLRCVLSRDRGLSRYHVN